MSLARVILGAAPAWLPEGTLPVSMTLEFDARVAGFAAAGHAADRTSVRHRAGMAGGPHLADGRIARRRPRLYGRGRDVSIRRWPSPRSPWL